MCTQTSAGTATAGGHGGGQSEPSLRVASGKNKNSSETTGPSSTVARVRDGPGTGTGSTELRADSGSSAGTANASKKSKRSKEGKKALAMYKAAIKILERLEGKSSQELTPKDRKDKNWAKETVENSRAIMESNPRLKSTNPAFPNKVEEAVHSKLAEKRQRSFEEPGEDTAEDKKLKRKHSGDSKIVPRLPISDVVKSTVLLVALIDRNVPYGKISGDKWKIVEMKLLDAMVTRTIEQPGEKLPVFDGAGWFNDCKILQCTDQFTLDWVKTEIGKLTSIDLWVGADLQVVPKADIPAAPKAKVFMPRVIPPDSALALLKGQNPDIPTADWKVLHVGKPEEKTGGQFYILQINQEAEKILFARFGKMAWGCGSVFLRLKKKKTGEAKEVEPVEAKKARGVSESESLLGLNGLQSFHFSDSDSMMSDEEVADDMNATVMPGAGAVGVDFCDGPETPPGKSASQ